MSTTKQDIREWLERGKAEKATHMIVVCDTFDWEDYPVFVKEGEDVTEIAGKQGKVMEVYSYNHDLEAQLNEYRAFHFD